MPESGEEILGPVISIRNHRLRWGLRTYVMAVINVTPDSFSGDGLTDYSTCVDRALQAVDEGADIIDIGGESTRPGHMPVDPKVELERILPVIAELRRRSDAVISVDTRSPEVFREAVHAGADIFNSVAGFEIAIVEAAADTGCPFVIMHQQSHTTYETDVVDCVIDYLETSARKAIEAGCEKNRIILDPGIGFGKLPHHNVALLRSLNRIKALGFPLMIGTSRKSTLGKITGRPVEQRVFATAATVALGVAAGVDIVRIHDVSAMVDVVRVSDAVVRGWTGAE